MTISIKYCYLPRKRPGKKTITKYVFCLYFHLCFHYREITEKRKIFDQQIKGEKKSIRDFIDYIKYEVDLFGRLTCRREALNGTNMDLENTVVCKILGLYKSAMTKYPDESRLYEQFMLFCKKCKCTSDVQPYLVQWTKVNALVYIKHNDMKGYHYQPLF